ncbi:MAG: SIR2 family protein [Spirochaetaceae bacterium]|jgi:hypothetical protein|nr:SIR2 family protein [Spirochaetaceae bacterium]
MSENEGKTSINILKVRDDDQVFKFKLDSEGKYKPPEDTDASWIEGGKITVQGLRKRIEPWLTALFQSEHLSLLIGSGLTKAIHKIATNGAPSQNSATGMDTVSFDVYSDEIEKAVQESAKKSEREQGNIEDQIRVVNELLAGLEIIGDPKKEKLSENLKNALRDFAISLLNTENNIATTVNETQRDEAFSVLTSFLMSFASRTGSRDRLNIFTTNYDRLIETGAELAGLHLLDRFLGSISPIFRSSRLDVDMHYNPPGIRGEPRYLEGVARFTKLHGSIDWVQNAKDIRRIGMPFGAIDIDPYLNAPGFHGLDALRIMIYPNAAKDRETIIYPYADLFRDFSAAVCRPNNTLVTYGYGFGDEHINRIIEDMLTIPSTHLVIISFDDPLERIMKIYKTRSTQISLLVGSEFGDITKLTSTYLPKAAIDKASFRMGEILRNRFNTTQPREDNNKNSDTEVEA